MDLNLQVFRGHSILHEIPIVFQALIATQRPLSTNQTSLTHFSWPSGSSHSIRTRLALMRLYNNRTMKNAATAQNVPRIAITTIDPAPKKATSICLPCLPDANTTCIAFSTVVRYANVTNDHAKFLPKNELKFVCSK